MAADVVSVRLIITGRVQGVGYRAWTVHTARKLGLVGWARNLTDGSVEVLAQGARANVESLVAACQAGPPSARVTEVNSTPVAAVDLTEFRQTATAEPGAPIGQA
jgi:acylphosphatase